MIFFSPSLPLSPSINRSNAWFITHNATHISFTLTSLFLYPAFIFFFCYPGLLTPLRDIHILASFVDLWTIREVFVVSRELVQYIVDKSLRTMNIYTSWSVHLFVICQQKQYILDWSPITDFKILSSIYNAFWIKSILLQPII